MIFQTLGAGWDAAHNQETPGAGWDAAHKRETPGAGWDAAHDYYWETPDMRDYARARQDMQYPGSKWWETPAMRDYARADIPERDMLYPGSTSRIVMDPALILGDAPEQVDADIAAAQKKGWGRIAAIAAVAAGAYFTMKG